MDSETLDNIIAVSGKSVKNYIIHVSTDVEREKHIRKEIAKLTFDSIFINDGDIKDISEEVIEMYFCRNGQLVPVNGATSCAYKHILACKTFLNSRADYALVLEDDIFLYKNFEKTVMQILQEIKERKLSNFFISLEESDLRYVKGSELEKGRLLYPKKDTRCAGAYIIDIECAKTIVNEIEKNKCHYPIDWMHKTFGETGLINVYWIHPPIAVQGSLNGKMDSILDGRFKRSETVVRQISFFFTRFYKKLLYRMR